MTNQHVTDQNKKKCIFYFSEVGGGKMGGGEKLPLEMYQFSNTLKINLSLPNLSKIT